MPQPQDAGPASAAEDTLRPWLLARGATVHPDAIARPIPSMGGGFGVVAATTLPARTTVATIPKNLLVTAKLARKHCRLPASVPAVDAIVIFLATERATVVAAGKAANVADSSTAVVPTQPADDADSDATDAAGFRTGPWAEWVARLPATYDNFVEVEDAVDAGLVNRVAAASPRRSPADQARLDATLADLFPFPRYRAKVAEELEVFHRLADRLLADAPNRHFQHLFEQQQSTTHVLPVVDRRLIRWAFNSLMSRGFSFSDEVWAMMPWVDYFNYAIDANVHPSEPVRGSPNAGGFDFHVAPGSTIRAGEQLLLSYGTYTDFELAMWYGFTLCGGAETSSASGGHHENCAYVVSPMSDTDGVVPVGAGWAVALAKAIGATTLPPSWSPVSKADLGRCRFGREGCTPHFRLLVDDIASANDIESSTIVARRLIEFELASAAAAAPKAAPGTDASPAAENGSPAPPLVAFAKCVAADSTALLAEILALDAEAFEAWLERDADM